MKFRFLFLLLVFTSNVGSSEPVELADRNDTDIIAANDVFEDVEIGTDDVNFREKRAANFYRTGATLARQISTTLDKLLGPSYNKRIRPMFGGPPVVVELNLSIRSIGPVDENSQAFFIDCYFRQSWYDDRLTFNTTGVTELPLNWKLLPKLWKPDTFFINGKKSKLHKITVPNRFLRISPQGRVSYSQRLTIHARCPMSLKKFPLDNQMCGLQIGSYGYTGDELLYRWKTPNPISLDELSLAQFHMVRWESGLSLNTTKRKIEAGFRNDSIAFLHFFFERQTGYFLLQIYTPLFMMVMCSWVAFWIVKSDAAGRCSLGITTVLSVIKIGFGDKGKPQVGYPTALDVYVLICLCSVFAAVIEYAVISSITIFMAEAKAREAKKQEVKKKEEEERKENENDDEMQLEEEMKNKFAKDDENGAKYFWQCLRNPGKCPDCIKSYFNVKPVTEMYVYKNTEEVLDRIDEESKKYFPLVFGCMMAVYWTTYLYLLEDEILQDRLENNYV